MYMYIHVHGKIGNRGRKELEERREGGRGEKRIKRTKRIETKYMEATMYSTCTCIIIIIKKERELNQKG